MEKDLHSAYFIAALRKRGTSLAALSREAALASPTLANALTRPWPKGERPIATALKVRPATIWPRRYNGQKDYHLPKHPLPGMKPALAEHYFPVPEKS